MIDIHAHVLPGIDDGAASLAESLRMLSTAASCGITDVIATPHVSISAKASIRSNAALVESLNVRLSEEEIPVRVHSGGEIRLTPGLLDVLVDGNLPMLAGSRYLLLELPSGTQPPNFAQILGRVQQRRRRVVLAHAERYEFIQRMIGSAATLVGNGVLIQVNAASISGENSDAEHRTALNLLSQGLVHFIASDAHDSDDYRSAIDKAFRVASRLIGPTATEAITRGNPSAILEDRKEFPLQPRVEPHTILSRLPAWLLGVNLGRGGVSGRRHRSSLPAGSDLTQSKG